METSFMFLYIVIPCIMIILSLILQAVIVIHPSKNWESTKFSLVAASFPNVIGILTMIGSIIRFSPKHSLLWWYGPVMMLVITYCNWLLAYRSAKSAKGKKELEDYINPLRKGADDVLSRRPRK